MTGDGSSNFDPFEELSKQKRRVLKFVLSQGIIQGRPFGPVTMSIQQFCKLLDPGRNWLDSELSDVSGKMLDNQAISGVYRNKAGRFIEFQMNCFTDVNIDYGKKTVGIEPNKSLSRFFNDPLTEQDLRFLD